MDAVQQALHAVQVGDDARAVELLLAAWRRRPSWTVRELLVGLMGDAEPPGPPVVAPTSDRAVAAWLEAFQCAAPEHLGAVLDPLIVEAGCAWSFGTPYDDPRRPPWRRAMARAVHAVRSRLPDPRVGWFALEMLRWLDSNDYFYVDEVAHAVTRFEPAEDPASRPPSLGVELVELVQHCSDPWIAQPLLDWIDAARSEADCNGADLCDRLEMAIGRLPSAPTDEPVDRVAIDQLQRHLDARPLPDEMPAALARRLDPRGTLRRDGRVVGLRLREGASIYARPSGVHRWAGWSGVRALDVHEHFRLRSRGVTQAVRSLRGVGHWAAADLFDLDPPCALEELAVNDPGMARSGTADESAPGDGWPTFARRVAGGATLPRLLHLDLCRAVEPARLRWLWTTALGRQLESLGVTVNDPLEREAWQREIPQLPGNVRVVRLYERPPTVGDVVPFEVVARD
jgi:hypothetical protein